MGCYVNRLRTHDGTGAPWTVVKKSMQQYSNRPKASILNDSQFLLPGCSLVFCVDFVVLPYLILKVRDISVIGELFGLTKHLLLHQCTVSNSRLLSFLQCCISEAVAV